MASDEHRHGGVQVSVLTAAWTFARPFLKVAWPYIAGALALWAALSWAEGKGVASGKASRNAEVAALVLDRDTAIANSNALKASVANQNAAVDRMALEAAAARQEAAAAVKAGDAWAKAFAGSRAQLEAIAKGKGACAVPIPKPIVDSWSKLK